MKNPYTRFIGIANPDELQINIIKKEEKIIQMTFLAMMKEQKKTQVFLKKGEKAFGTNVTKPLFPPFLFSTLSSLLCSQRLNFE